MEFKNESSIPIVEFRHNGDVYIKGELIEKEVGIAFKELLYPNIKKNENYNEMLEMLKDILEQREDGRDYVSLSDMRELVKKATS